MKILVKTLVITTVFLISLSGTMQAQFNISGEFKMRGEYRDGYLLLRDSSKTPYTDIVGRARLLFDYTHEKFSTRFSLYDAWVFGQNFYSSDTISKNTVNIYEAWFKYNFKNYLGMKIGRMELVYDDERLLGCSNWSMWGATHDVVIVQYDRPSSRSRADAGFGINNTAPATAYKSSYNIGRNYKYIGYLYVNQKFAENKLSVSVLGIVDAFQKSSVPKSTVKTDTVRTYNQNDSLIGYTVIKTTIPGTEQFMNTIYARATVGAGVLYSDKKWSFFLNGYYQGGHSRDGRKLSSNFYAASVSWQAIKKLKVQAGYEHLSGNNFSDTTTYKTKVKGFSTLYGTTHRGYGYMDLFTILVKDNQSPGLNDLYGRATFEMDDKMSLEATWRWFSLPYGYLSKSTAKNPYAYIEVSKSLGSEIDLMYIYKPVANLELNAAYCFFLPTSTMEQYNGLKTGTSKFAQFAYIMITYKPNFFNSGKH